MKIDFWFEFASTYSYPVAMKIEKLAQDNGVSIEWKPFLLGPIFKEQGWSDSPFNIYPEKGRYMWRDLERICQSEGLKFVKPSVFPRSGLMAARIACMNAQENWLPEFVRSVYAANFELDLDISDKAVIADCLPFSASEKSRVIEEGTSAEAKELLRDNTNSAKKLGIFGAPTFIVNKEMFWGSDRLEQAIYWSKA